MNRLVKPRCVLRILVAMACVSDCSPCVFAQTFATFTQNVSPRQFIYSNPLTNVPDATFSASTSGSLTFFDGPLAGVPIPVRFDFSGNRAGDAFVSSFDVAQPFDVAFSFSRLNGPASGTV